MGVPQTRQGQKREVGEIREFRGLANSYYNLFLLVDSFFDHELSMSATLLKRREAPVSQAFKEKNDDFDAFESEAADAALVAAADAATSKLAATASTVKASPLKRAKFEASMAPEINSEGEKFFQVCARMRLVEFSSHTFRLCTFCLVVVCSRVSWPCSSPESAA